MGPTACTDELRFSLPPSTLALRVGDTYSASLQLSTCGGRKQLTDTIIWRSDSSAIASVDARGRIRGQSVGQTTIRVSAVGYGVDGTILVTVGAP